MSTKKRVARNKEQKVKWLTCGMLTGSFLAFVLLIVVFFLYQSSHNKVIKWPSESGTTSKDKKKKDFFNSFEVKSEVNYFTREDGLFTAVSTDHFTDGQQSLLTEFPQGASYPGLLREIYDRNVLDWSGAEAMAFDVYNDQENPASLELNIKSGRQYPKRSFERTFSLPVKEWKTIKVSQEDLSKFLNLRHISYIKFYMANPQQTTRLYFDNLRLINKGEVVQLPEEKMQGQKEDRTAQAVQPLLELHVDPSHHVRPVSPLIYGSNLTAKTEFEMDVARFAKETGLTNFRFPGGGSDGYRWKKGAFDFSDRVDDAPLSEMKNVIKFSEIMGSQLVIQVNVESGTPEEAALWVAHMNQNEETYVKYWELGNEVYGDWDKAFMPGEKYAELIKEYADLMKKVDPTIKIGANWGGPNYQAFDEAVMKLAGDDIDFISYHWYPNHINKERQYNGRTHPFPKEIMANSLAVTDAVDRVDRMIQKYVPQRKGKIEIGFLEWDGSWDAVASDPNKEAAGMMWSLANAIFYADTLGQFARQGIALANQYCLQETMFGLIRGWDKEAGWGGSRWDGRTIRPKALAMKLFARYFGDILIESRLDGSPTYYKEKDWRADSYTGEVPYVECYASTFSDENKMVLVFTNKHAEKDFKVNIKVTGAQPVEKGTAWVLNGPELIAQNDGSPETVDINKYDVLGIKESFIYRVPAHSVSAIEIRLGSVIK